MKAIDVWMVCSDAEYQEWKRLDAEKMGEMWRVDSPEYEDEGFIDADEVELLADDEIYQE